MIHLSSDWSEIDNELDRIAGLPDFKTKAYLGAVLNQGYVESLARTHVDTGSLKSSGSKEEKFVKSDKRWEGEISFGGPSAGVNNPVDYAIYEKARGEDHDFTANLHLLGPLWVTAVKAGLKG